MPGTMMQKDDAQAALMAALARAKRPDPELWDIWLWSGANINSPCAETGKTALMAAAERGDVADINYLLSRSAKVNEANPQDGKTALMYAASAEHMGAIERLLVAGADTMARDHNLWLAADHAKAGTAAHLLLSPVCDARSRSKALSNSMYTQGQQHAGKFKLRRR